MNCSIPSIDGPSSVADMLRSVDCATGQVTRIAFERIFGIHGTLGFALTAALTIYVAILAITLLIGRSTMRLSLLTPRALTIGMVLTFATSWVAYQQVVWNLAAGAPDQIASVLLGSHGSAVHLFASQLDKLFVAITDTAKAVSAATTDVAHKNAPFAPTDLLWFSALLLLLGTAGVLIVARIALAAMLAIGPLFIVLALFEGTRGLFVGWLKTVILFAVLPLLTVLVGSGALLLLDPMVQSLALSGDTPSIEMALGIFMGASIYTALMLMAVKAATMLAGALQLPSGNVAPVQGRAAVGPSAILQTLPEPARNASQDERIRELVSATQSSLSSSSSHLVERTRAVGAPSYLRPQNNRGSNQERLRGLGATRLKKESRV
jgi:type IV secretion system protein VirB6